MQSFIKELQGSENWLTLQRETRNIMEGIIGIIFIIFILAKVLFGKEDGGGNSGHRPSPGRSDDSDDGEKYPPSYY